jgi:hypothetical protein
MRNERTINGSVDIYALGHLAYTLLVGEPYWFELFKKNVPPVVLVAEMLGGATEPPSARAARTHGILLPVAFDAWFCRATAPSPTDRYEHAALAAAALAAALGVPAPNGLHAVQSPPAEGSESAQKGLGSASISTQAQVTPAALLPPTATPLSLATGWSCLRSSCFRRSARSSCSIVRTSRPVNPLCRWRR